MAGRAGATTTRVPPSPSEGGTALPPTKCNSLTHKDQTIRHTPQTPSERNRRMKPSPAKPPIKPRPANAAVGVGMMANTSAL